MIHKLYRFLVFGLIVCLLSFALAAAQSKRKTVAVAELFRNNCARCHGMDGRGDTPQGEKYQVPDFTDKEWWRKDPASKTSSALTSIVARGKEEMPAFGKTLSPAEIKQLVSHVRRFRS